MTDKTPQVQDASTTATATLSSRSKDFERFQRYGIDDVAPLCLVSVSYFRMCLWANYNEAYRKQRGISLRRLRTLPLSGWEKSGGRWTITHDRLWRQLEALNRVQ